MHPLKFIEEFRKFHNHFANFNMETPTSYSEEIKFLTQGIETWKDIPSTSFSFQILTGISNAVYKVTTDAKVAPHTVILRKFGNTEEVIDKEKESIFFNAMSESGRGPKCYAESSKYRIEEYFDAVPIQTTQINEPYWRRKLAVTFAKHHALEVSGIEKNHIILERLDEAKFYESFNTKCVTKDGFSEEQLKKLNELKTLGSREEREFVKSITPSENLVFSHNDTLNGNILVTKGDQRLILIDYEYSGYNNRAYDAANLFVESMMTYNKICPPFFTIDEQIFPKLEDVKDFARYYIYASLYNNDPEVNDLESDDIRLSDDAWLLEKIEKELNDKDFDKELRVFLDEFQKCCLLSQYYWTTWGVLMYKLKSDSESFDYLSFAYEKFKYYLKWKEQIEQSNSILE